MAKLLIWVTTDQHTGEHIVQHIIFFVHQTNAYFGIDFFIDFETHLVIPVIADIDQLSRAAIIKLRREQNHVSRFEVIWRHFQENVVCGINGVVDRNKLSHKITLGS
ncbi:Uncharacterised protein [Vibrio cholerae]|nr:Uncharacterised protein [Vibrio cholerae]CRZ69104.1 Uncharacterised protein [Vibrio cholerae]CSA03238.1 Uncharacterised protein [Vibrio cholerae]CSB22431.1 Uncharacterised protein [Vibrio cholerae]CSB61321.1 Uncharacterised protein [Vibrio cholerae]